MDPSGTDFRERHGYLWIWIFSVQLSDPDVEQELITNPFCAGGRGQNQEHKQLLNNQSNS
jgi:hypothetical protein